MDWKLFKKVTLEGALPSWVLTVTTHWGKDGKEEYHVSSSVGEPSLLKVKTCQEVEAAVERWSETHCY